MNHGMNKDVQESAKHLGVFALRVRLSEIEGRREHMFLNNLFSRLIEELGFEVAEVRIVVAIAGCVESVEVGNPREFRPYLGSPRCSIKFLTVIGPGDANRGFWILESTSNVFLMASSSAPRAQRASAWCARWLERRQRKVK